LKNETPDSTSIFTSNKEPEGIQKGIYMQFATQVLRSICAASVWTDNPLCLDTPSVQTTPSVRTPQAYSTAVSSC